MRIIWMLLRLVGFLLCVLRWFLWAAPASAGCETARFPPFFLSSFPSPPPSPLGRLGVLLEHTYAGWSARGTASLLQIISSRPLCVEAARLQSWSTVGSQVRLVHFRRERALCLQVSSSHVRWLAGNAGSDYFELTMKDCLLHGDHLPRGFCT